MLMRIKWFGTATILIEQDGARLLFDPFLSRSEKGYKPPIDELAAVENILVTHGHLDHIADIPAIIRQGNGKATVYCTQTPWKTLISKGLDSERIHTIQPGDMLDFPPFEVRVLKGKHVKIDLKLITQTFLSPRMIKHRKNLRYLLRENKIRVESGETVIYDIRTPGERILLIGSLNLDDSTVYPEGVDLLILPFQGRSDLAKYAMRFIERLKPKEVLLDHFDDTFPPISSKVETEGFIKNMRRAYPDIPVICRPVNPEWITWH